MGEGATRDAYRRATLAAYRLLAERGGGSILEEGGLLLASGPHPQALIANAAFRVDRNVQPEDALNRARRHYAERGFDFAFNTSVELDADIDEAATAADWQLILNLPGMVIESRIADAQPADGVSLRRADRADGASFGESRAASPSEEEADGYRALFRVRICSTDRLLLPDGGRRGDARSAGSDRRRRRPGRWIGTLPERGGGPRRARHPRRHKRGIRPRARIVALQASPQGFPVYARLGYRTISRKGSGCRPTDGSTCVWVGSPAEPPTRAVRPWMRMRREPTRRDREPPAAS